MPHDKTSFSIKPILDQLRQEFGDSEFGYRVQALFAHVLGRLGAKIIEINAQGHPDLRVILGDRELLIQVKTSKHGSWSTMFVLEVADLAGITSGNRRDGYLAFLDCAEPVSWLLVPYDRVRLLLGQTVHVATLRAEQDKGLSEECNDEFSEILRLTADRLPLLTYSVLRHRALAGQYL